MTTSIEQTEAEKKLDPMARELLTRIIEDQKKIAVFKALPLSSVSTTTTPPPTTTPRCVSCKSEFEEKGKLHAAVLIHLNHIACAKCFKQLRACLICRFPPKAQHEITIAEVIEIQRSPQRPSTPPIQRSPTTSTTEKMTSEIAGTPPTSTIETIGMKTTGTETSTTTTTKKEEEEEEEELVVNLNLFDMTHDQAYEKEEKWCMIRGGRPYYAPSGWKRIGVNVPGFEEQFGAWPVSFHGTNCENVLSLLEFGLLNPGKGAVKSIHGAAYAKKGERPIYCTPSVEYASLYSKALKMNDGKWAQVVLQLRVHPDGFETNSITLDQKTWPHHIRFDGLFVFFFSFLFFSSQPHTHTHTTNQITFLQNSLKTKKLNGELEHQQM